jgi:hypothetical protein
MRGFDDCTPSNPTYHDDDSKDCSRCSDLRGNDEQLRYRDFTSLGLAVGVNYTSGDTGF